MLKYSDFKYDLCCLGIRGVTVSVRQLVSSLMVIRQICLISCLGEVRRIWGGLKRDAGRG